MGLPSLSLQNKSQHSHHKPDYDQNRHQAAATPPSGWRRRPPGASGAVRSVSSHSGSSHSRTAHSGSSHSGTTHSRSAHSGSTSGSMHSIHLLKYKRLLYFPCNHRFGCFGTQTYFAENSIFPYYTSFLGEMELLQETKLLFVLFLDFLE